MRRKAHLAIVFVAATIASVVPALNGPLPADSDARLSPEARLVAIRRAQVWTPTNVSTMDIKTGPKGKGALSPNATVTCDYVEKKMNGRSPKFTCRVAADDEVKIKYGKDNGEVYAEVAATRLMWALGFYADRMYPVRVVCRGCPAEIAVAAAKSAPGESTFEPTALERQLDGQALEVEPSSGWAWPELELVEETVGGAPRAHRDALKLLAVMIQHTDNKAEQQRLMCPAGEPVSATGEPCLHPFMAVSDLGLTFGKANVYNRNAVGSANFEQWSRMKVWADAEKCLGDITRSQTGTLDHPRISEAGRKFLADRLTQLSDAQLRDLFETARFSERTGGGRQASVEEWVGTFKQKRDEIVNARCPD